MNIQVGHPASDFKLYDTDKNEVGLKDYEGKNLLILFFPQAFTGTCITELCSIRDSLSDYNNLESEVLAISVDSVFTLNRFKEDQKLNFPLLSDFNKEVSKSYGAFYEEFVLGMKGVSKRAAFVVDHKGIIQYAEILESSGDLPNFDSIKKTLSSL